MRKRFITGLLAFAITSFCAAAAFSAEVGNVLSALAEGQVTSTDHLEMEKTEFLVGEPINVKTKGVTNTGALVYLVKKGWENETTTASGGVPGQNVCIRYKYAMSTSPYWECDSLGVSAGVDNLYYWDMRSASRISNNSNSSLADVPAGDYEMLYVPSYNYETSYTEKLSFTVKESGVSDVKNLHISVPKTTYDLGETISVSTLSMDHTKDWIGYATLNGTASIGWAWCDTTKTYDFTPAASGSYRIGFVHNDGYFFMMSEAIVVTVTSGGGGGEAKTAHMKLNKTEFAAGEAIYITPTVQTVGKLDWFGICVEDYTTANGSIVWKYIEKGSSGDKSDGAGSGVMVNAMTDMYVAKSDQFPFAPGIYSLVFVPDNGYAYQATEVIKFTVTSSSPEKPSSVAYALDDETSGLADGEVTVTFEGYDDLPSATKPTSLAIYWGDGNGNKLAGYSSWATRTVTGETTKFDTYDNVMIPSKAKEIIVYGIAGNFESEEGTRLALPEGSAIELPEETQSEFQVVSDIHVANNQYDINNQHYRSFLEAVKKYSPDSTGIFINGDAANTGSATQYDFLKSTYNSVGDLPMMYFGMGNHEHLNGQPDGSSYLAWSSSWTDAFIRWRDGTSSFNDLGRGTAETNYYDFWLNGCHYIFLGNESYCSDNAFITPNQLAWLKAKLDENRFGNPIYLFCHQGLYDTVAGTLSWQGWHGIISDGVNRDGWAYPLSAEESAIAEKPLRDVLKDYPEIVMFSGHSHWDMNTVSCMREADELLPTIFNTSAVGYIWDDRNIYIEGSQAYFVDVYHDQLVVRGYDVKNDCWIASAQFVVKNTTHNMVHHEAVEATCQSEGHTEGLYCSVCEKVFLEEQVVPKKPHDYTYIDAYDHHIKVCQVCEEVENDDHHYNEDGICVECGHVKPAPSPSKKDSKTTIIIVASSVGGAVVLGGAVTAFVLIKKHKKIK